MARTSRYSSRYSAAIPISASRNRRQTVSPFQSHSEPLILNLYKLLACLFITDFIRCLAANPCPKLVSKRALREGF